MPESGLNESAGGIIAPDSAGAAHNHCQHAGFTPLTCHNKVVARGYGPARLQAVDASDRTQQPIGIARFSVPIGEQLHTVVAQGRRVRTQVGSRHSRHVSGSGFLSGGR